MTFYEAVYVNEYSQDKPFIEARERDTNIEVKLTKEEALKIIREEIKYWTDREKDIENFKED